MNSGAKKRKGMSLKKVDLKALKKDSKSKIDTPPVSMQSVVKDVVSDSSSSTNTPKARVPLSNSPSTKQQRQKEAMQKLATNFKKKTSEMNPPDQWQSLITNLLNSQRGKLPLLLAVEAGNQSMVRELLSAQTAEQLKVSFFVLSISMVKRFCKPVAKEKCFVKDCVRHIYCLHLNFI